MKLQFYYIFCVLVISFLVFFPSFQGQVVITQTIFETSTVEESIGNWVQLHPSCAPWSRTGNELMTYDIESAKTILFSGRFPEIISGEDFVYYTDTWTFDFTTASWTNVTPAISPIGRSNPGLAYDAESDRIILFGGAVSAVGGGTYTEAPPETWAYDTNTNTWTNMSPSTAPSPRLACSMVYDTESDRVILYGGYTRDLSITNAPFFDDTWAYDYNTNTWEQMNPVTKPSKVADNGFGYDIESDKSILFGGSTGGFEPLANRFKNETWAYDYNTDTWTQIITTKAPTPRWVTAMDYDNESDRIILFGGTEAVGGKPTDYVDTWAFDYNTLTWTDMNSPTHATSHSSLVYDYSADKMILFGGRILGAPTTYLNETWAYHYQLNPPSAPLNINISLEANGVKLTWVPPATDAGSSITNYLIYRGTESGSLSLLTTLGVVSEYTDPSTPDNSFFYAISAKNAIGEGPLSGEIDIVITTASTPSFQVLIISCTLGLLVLHRKKKS